jgi:hypothetical protein
VELLNAIVAPSIHIELDNTLCHEMSLVIDASFLDAYVELTEKRAERLVVHKDLETSAYTVYKSVQRAFVYNKDDHFPEWARGERIVYYKNFGVARTLKNDGMMCIICDE